MRTSAMRLALLLAIVGCKGADGAPGPAGARGAEGSKGERGADGLPGDAGPPSAIAGTRLRPMIRTNEDGSSALDGWYDETLKTSCVFSPMLDGVERCLPPSLVVRQPPLVMFADPNCTQGLISEPTQASPSCSELPAFVSNASAVGSCSLDVFAVDKTPTSAPMMVYRFYNDGGCQPSPAPVSSTWYSLGPAMKASAFVGGMIH